MRKDCDKLLGLVHYEFYLVLSLLPYVHECDICSSDPKTRDSSADRKGLFIMLVKKMP